MVRALETACTHTLVRTAVPLIIDRGLYLLLPLPRTGVGVLTECRLGARAHLYMRIRDMWWSALLRLGP